MTMKKIKLLCDPATKFSIGGEHVRADQLTLAQAELVAGQFPNQFVAITEEKAASAAGDKTENGK